MRHTRQFWQKWYAAGKMAFFQYLICLLGPRFVFYFQFEIFVSLSGWNIRYILSIFVVWQNSNIGNIHFFDTILVLIKSILCS